MLKVTLVISIYLKLVFYKWGYIEIIWYFFSNKAAKGNITSEDDF